MDSLLSQFSSGLKRKIAEGKTGKPEEIIDKMEKAVDTAKSEIAKPEADVEKMVDSAEEVMAAVREAVGGHSEESTEDLPDPLEIKKALAKVAEVVSLEMARRYRKTASVRELV